jgi:hypothetical protein
MAVPPKECSTRPLALVAGMATRCLYSSVHPAGDLAQIVGLETNNQNWPKSTIPPHTSRIWSPAGTCLASRLRRLPR